jgi:dUTP pyrophosphatase
MSNPLMLINIECPMGQEPEYQTDGASGADIRARLPAPLTIKPGEAKLMPTGIKMAIPLGYEIQIRPRSGLALHHGITVLNTPGTIDSDYRGEIQVILMNHSNVEYTVRPMDRIAQVVLAPVARALYQHGPIDGSERGASGFGSTGL